MKKILIILLILTPVSMFLFYKYQERLDFYRICDITNEYEKKIDLECGSLGSDCYYQYFGEMSKKFASAVYTKNGLLAVSAIPVAEPTQRYILLRGFAEDAGIKNYECSSFEKIFNFSDTNQEEQ